MRILRVDDPRDPLDRAGRDQLYRFAIARGVKEIDEKIYNGANAAVFMRMILRQKGITDINVPHHQLGMPPQTAEQTSGKPAQRIEDVLSEQLNHIQSQTAITEAVKEDSKLAREIKEEIWAKSRNISYKLEKDLVSIMGIHDLRTACKVRGVKIERTDNIAKLREKLLGQTAS